MAACPTGMPCDEVVSRGKPLNYPLAATVNGKEQEKHFSRRPASFFLFLVFPSMPRVLQKSSIGPVTRLDVEFPAWRYLTWAMD